jgi:WD40 repeat protein
VLQSGMLIRTVGDITGGPNPDTKPGVILGGVTHALAGDPFIPSDAPVVGVRLSQDASLIAVEAVDGTFMVWDVSSYASLFEAGVAVFKGALPAEPANINLSAGGNIMAFSPDNSQLAIGDNTGRVILWNFLADSVQRVEAFPGTPIQHVAFNNDGSILAVSAGALATSALIEPATEANGIRLYDVSLMSSGQGNALLTTLVQPTQMVTGLAFGMNGQTLITTSADSFFSVWGVPENFDASQIQPVATQPPQQVAIQPTAIPAQPCSHTFFIAQSTGCAQGDAVSTNGVYQSFQNGFMIWIGDTKSILVAYNDGSARLYSDLWAGQMVITDSLPPTGTFQPDHGFGWVWTQEAGVKDGIGWATSVEVPYTVMYQVGSVDSPGPRPPGLNYYTLPDGFGTPIEVTFGDGAASWHYVS